MSAIGGQAQKTRLFEQLAEVADGSVFTGRQAQAKGLIDALGGDIGSLSAVIVELEADLAAGAALAKELVRRGHPAAPPACLILGGETTVPVRRPGNGGRHQQIALARALAPGGAAPALAVALATDGPDRPPAAPPRSPPARPPAASRPPPTRTGPRSRGRVAGGCRARVAWRRSPR